MVTRTPRVGVTLSDAARDVIERLAELEGTSMSKVISSIVDEFLPVALQLVELGEATAHLNDSQRAKLREVAEAMETGILPQTQETVAAFTEALAQARNIVTGKTE